jgi:hypothetical protein
MILFAMAGQMGSGKDTAAKHLVDAHGFTKLAFADNLKEMCKAAFSLTDYDVYDEEGKFKKFQEPVTLTPDHLRKIIVWALRVNGFEFGEEVIDKCLALKGKVFETPREVLQFVGTEICRMVIHPDFHAEVVRMKIEREGLQKVVISDCRFLNEREAVKKWRGTNVLITGRTTQHEASDFSKGHASENSLGSESEYDVTIVNNGTLEELYNMVDQLVGSRSV